jgi:hypothetical protein
MTGIRYRAGALTLAGLAALQLAPLAGLHTADTTVTAAGGRHDHRGALRSRRGA